MKIDEPKTPYHYIPPEGEEVIMEMDDEAKAHESDGERSETSEGEERAPLDSEEGMELLSGMMQKIREADSVGEERESRRDTGWVSSDDEKDIKELEATHDVDFKKKRSRHYDEYKRMQEFLRRHPHWSDEDENEDENQDEGKDDDHNEGI
eukprot:TRINITY_DN90_c0_g1_i4.p1 TRINITY_DN90_c0_g1~~TRINITY_DN90_c0_g1_i4.p1  ORF type:complete len:151 (-),score=68.79 TRINITY_DN90_c0_g1_i4:206-658(-)